MKIIKIIIFLSFITITALSQRLSDTTIAIPLISGSFDVQIPGGDMADRYGLNFSISPAVTYKTAKNILFTAEYSLIFGGTINEDDMFRNIKTDENAIINRYGEYTRLALLERGFNAKFKIGKLFKPIKYNKNCGFYANIGAGILQHKIRIEVDGNNSPQLDEEYKKGYDRLSNGLSINEEIGFMFFHKRGTINFYIAIEFTQAFTQSRRDINFDTYQKEDQMRNDYLYGIKFGWILPFYKKMPEKYYYY